MDNKAFYEFPETPDDDLAFDVVESTAIVPIEGVILNKCSGMELMCGGFSLQEFKETLSEISARVDISNVILSIDSGGGTAQGVPEAAEAIQRLRKAGKYVVAYTDGCAASAAYWLACQASRVYLSQSAELGSIGVYCAFLDESAAYAKEGYKVELFKGDNAEYKAMGYPGLSLTEPQRAELQAGVDKCFSEFKATVEANRKSVNQDVFTARVYEGQDAVTVGLADGVINNLTDLVAFLNQ